jgi:hypothetical protein
MKTRPFLLVIAFLLGVALPAWRIPELRTYWKVAAGAFVLTAIACMIAILASGQYKQGKE